MNDKFSEKGFVNRIALLGHTIIDSVLFLAYALEVFKGSRTLGSFHFCVWCRWWQSRFYIEKITRMI